MSTHPAHLVLGPARHGVVSFALDLVDALVESGHPAPVIRCERWADLDALLPRGGVHVNFTDRLFGPTPAEAADRVVALARRVAATGGHVTAALHDIPQQADGGNFRERVLAYRTVCEALRGCAVNSEHERSLLSESRIVESADVTVIPLPLRIDDAPVRRSGSERPSVAVLGFLYPGKGHAEVLAAMAGLPPEVEFLAIGTCSAGHDDLAGQLAAAARVADRAFTVTGYVPGDALSNVLQRVSVPIAHHRHVSASGSLNTWIGAHRRPLAPENRYTVEHAQRHPGTVRLYPDTPRGIAAAIESALSEPDATWLTPGTASGSTPADTARLYAAALTRWHG